MQDLVELERRIAAALERIGRGIDALPVAAPEPEPGPAPVAEPVAAPDPAVLSAEEEAERASMARLRERLAAARDRETVLRSEYDERIEKLTRQLDVQGMELQRMRKTALTLREELRRLREAQSAGLADPAQINRALLAELDALRAARLSEMAELEEINAALDLHLTSAELEGAAHA